LIEMGYFINDRLIRIKTHLLPVKRQPRQPRRCRRMAFDSHLPPIEPGPPFLHEVIGKIKSGIYDLGLGLDGIHNSYDIASITRILELRILESRD